MSNQEEQVREFSRLINVLVVDGSIKTTSTYKYILAAGQKAIEQAETAARIDELMWWKVYSIVDETTSKAMDYRIKTLKGGDQGQYNASEAKVREGN